MSALHSVAAEILEASAPGYAAAANALLQTRGNAAASLDATAWKKHLSQRILELAAAVRTAEPALFARRVLWLRRAVVARGADEQELKRAIQSLRDALGQEMPEHLRGTVAPALDLALRVLDEALPPDPATTLDASLPSHRLALEYLAACLEGDPRRGIRLVLGEIERGLAPATVYAEVIMAAQKEIGQLWHVGDASIAEERLVSEATRELMALIADRYAPPPTGRVLVAAAVTGNAHDIGLRAAADLFRLAGWRCAYLGASVPAAEIASAAEGFDADLVLLNATLSTHLKSLAEAIAEIRVKAPGRKILVGGSALDDSPELWRHVGADGHAPTIGSAVSIGSKLVNGS